MKTAEREEARRLRHELGLPMKEIARRVGVSVSSVSLWVRDVPLSPEQEAALLAKDPVRNGRLLGTHVHQEQCRQRRAEAQAHGRAMARTGDPVHRGGCMLYWAEGSKTRNCVQLVNADGDLLVTFLDFLRTCYAVPDTAITFSVNCFLGNGLSLAEIERWWLDRLALPESCLRTAAVNRASVASKRKRRTLLHGTGRLSVHSTYVVQSIYGAIQQYAGIDRPEWLDL